jgi:hypothetical protein
MIASLVAKAVLRLAPELKAPYLERMQQGA